MRVLQTQIAEMSFLRHRKTCSFIAAIEGARAALVIQQEEPND